MRARRYLGTGPPLVLADRQNRARQRGSGPGCQCRDRGAVPGTCREERPVLEDWSFGTTGGKLVCYESSNGDAVLLWGVDGSQLFARAVRDDKDMDALLDWWEDVGRFAAP